MCACHRMTLQLVDVLVVAVVLSSGAVVCAPLGGLTAETGWSQGVRLRHLYAARTGLHLQVSADGQVHGSEQQTPYSLLEITAVSPGCVVLRGVASGHFLCMQGDATLYTTATFRPDDCTFREQILADGYSVYSSLTHGQLLSLGSPRQRQRGQDRGLPALAQFLPRLDVPESPPRRDPTTGPPARPPVDHMDSFGQLSQIVHSPSFHER